MWPLGSTELNTSQKLRLPQQLFMAPNNTPVETDLDGKIFAYDCHMRHL